MSEDIELRDNSDHHQQGGENIYASLHSRTPPKKTGPNSSTIVRYRCAVVCLGVLCLLLAISIGLGVLWLKATSDASSSILSRDKSQLETNYSILSREKSQLETNYSILSREKSQLETNYGILSREKSSLQEGYDRVNREKSQLQDKYDRLTRNESQLQERCDAIAAERDTLLQRTVTAKKQIAKYAVDVTLDPDTAHTDLILSADWKQVKDSDTSQNRTDNPKRFDILASVLSKQGFSSGRFYYEVQVSGKTGWSLGVARASINRKGGITLIPENGYWTIWLKNSMYQANASPPVPLSLKEKPERVGVFVDYGAGLVSFYDADRWSPIYSYKGVSFTEEIYPYFNPHANNNGINSAPLVITSAACFK